MNDMANAALDENTPVVSDCLEKQAKLQTNDEIASVPTFLCRKCSKLLRCPIVLLKSMGLICEDCAHAEDAKSLTTVTRNSPLEIVLQGLVVPCRNTDRGCNARLRYFHMLSHDLICIYGDYPCPTQFFTDCGWKGSLTDIVTHGSTRHQDLSVKGNYNYFDFDVSFRSFYNEGTVKVLYTDDECFVLRMKLNAVTNQLYCIMYCVDTREENTSGSHYTILGNTNRISTTFAAVLSFKNAYSKYFDTKRAETFPFANSGAGRYRIVVLLNNHKNEDEEDNKLLKFLECIVCNYTMKPPIYQCSVGHNLCNTCIKKLQKCPVCEATYTGTRNFTLEALCEETILPCNYSKYGCRVSLRIGEIEQHESACQFKTFECPFFKECDWQGSLFKHENHLKLCHNNQLIFNCYDRRRIKVSPDCLEVYCMIAYGRIFRVCHKQSKETKKAYWNVQINKKTNEMEKYRYEVGLVHSQNESKRFIKSDICRRLHNKFPFEKSIEFSNQDVSLFSSNNEFTYYCKIIKLVL